MSAFSKSKVDEVLSMYNGRCAYCGRVAPLTIDHIVPKNRGGSNAKENLIPACECCNEAKSDRTVEEFRNDIFLRKQIWQLTLQLSTKYFSKPSNAWQKVLSRFANCERVTFWLDGH